MDHGDNYNNAYIMIFVMILAGFFATMNVWVVDKKHARFHLNDVYMVLLMVSWMVFFGFLLMKNHMMIPKTIFYFSILIIMVLIYMIRKQSLINEKQYLNGMIPHHSMAILMSEKIKDKTKDQEIKELADEIIQSQQKEIIQMTNILNRTNNNNYVL